MNDEKLYLSGVCPYCPAVLDYCEDAKAVVCHCCGNTVPTRILRPLNFEENTVVANEHDRRIADGVVSSGTGIIYFDNFCETYDWREFATTPSLSIPILDSIAETCKIKFPADPITYYLDFRCIAIPILKKIEGLDLLEIEIIDNYKSDDNSDLFEYVDRYSTITRLIVSKRDYYIEKLRKDIVLSKRFLADDRMVEDLERSFEVFVDKINAVEAVSKIEEIPGYLKAKTLKDAILAEKIRNIGIDAEKTYRKAKALLSQGNVDNALHLFAAIDGYKDSTQLIADNSKIFKFNNELTEMAGKYYLVRKRPGYFDVEDPEVGTSDTLVLYEIVDQAPTTRPALTHMSDLIHSFGTKIFFIRNSVSISCFDTKCEDLEVNVKILDEGAAGDYLMSYKTPIYYSSDKTKFFIRKKLHEARTAKKGCFSRRKKKTDTKYINRGNNFAIVLVDMDNVTSKVILPYVVDVMDYYDDKIFYTTVKEGEKDPSFLVYDIKTETNTEILDSQCIIHDVNNGHIIYSLRAPSEYNSNLYSIDIDSKVPYLIDTNVRGYYKTYGEHIFYTIGTGDDCRLYSATFKGDEKAEVMSNPGRICTIRSGWLYYINGTGMNACLMKVRFDGSESVLVASRFAKLVKMTHRHVFYMSASGDLRVVRNDGNEDRRIAAQIKDTHIIIDDEHVYYLKKDFLGPKDGDEEGFGYSLYSTDIDGRNLHKIAHDVTAMQEYSDRYIYICKHRKVKYSIMTPLTKRSSRTEIIETEIVYYESYDKVTGEFKEIVHFGVPVPTSITYKKSWWPFSSKTITKNGYVRQIQPYFQRDDVAKVGMIRNEELEREHMKLERIERDRIEKEIAKAEKKAAKKARKAEKRAEKAAKKEAKKEKKEAKKEQQQAAENASENALNNADNEPLALASAAPQESVAPAETDFNNSDSDNNESEAISE